MRHLALFGAAVLLSLAACGGGPEEGETPAEAPKAEAPKAEPPKPATPKGDCCKVTAELKAQMPKCCINGAALCCKEAKSDPKNKADCCKKGDALTAKMPDCCKKAAAGTPQACCNN